MKGIVISLVLVGRLCAQDCDDVPPDLAPSASYENAHKIARHHAKGLGVAAVGCALAAALKGSRADAVANKAIKSKEQWERFDGAIMYYFMEAVGNAGLQEGEHVELILAKALSRLEGTPMKDSMLRYGEIYAEFHRDILSPASETPRMIRTATWVVGEDVYNSLGEYEQLGFWGLFDSAQNIGTVAANEAVSVLSEK